MFFFFFFGFINFFLRPNNIRIRILILFGRKKKFIKPKKKKKNIKNTLQTQNDRKKTDFYRKN